MKQRVDRTLRLLILLNLVIVAMLAAMMVANWLQVIPTRSTAPADANAAGASPSGGLFEMGIAHIPTSAQCVLCHESGGSEAVKTIPAMGHPLAGFTACLTCHTNDKLGRAAPGHDGIPETECTNCHKEPTQGPSITQAHAALNTPCLDCHGSVAHLPTSMVGRNEKDCELCHKPNPSPPPIKPHPDPQNLKCRDCHQASNVGALPIDHALRGDETCVLCHDIGGASNLASPPAVIPTSPAPSSPSSLPLATPQPSPSG
jgi:hypothetical protein